VDEVVDSDVDLPLLTGKSEVMDSSCNEEGPSDGEEAPTNRWSGLYNDGSNQRQLRRDNKRARQQKQIRIINYLTLMTFDSHL
jgi:hypothetical protein